MAVVLLLLLLPVLLLLLLMLVIAIMAQPTKPCSNRSRAEAAAVQRRQRLSGCLRWAVCQGSAAACCCHPFFVTCDV